MLTTQERKRKKISHAFAVGNMAEARAEEMEAMIAHPDSNNRIQKDSECENKTISKSK